MNQSESGRPSLRHVALVCGQLLVIGLFGWLVLRVVESLSRLVIPIGIGLILAALLLPLARALPDRIPRYGRAGLVMLGFLAVLGLISWISGNQLVTGVLELVDSLPGMVGKLEDWLKGLGFASGIGSLEAALDSGQKWLDDNASDIARHALTAGSSIITAMTGAALALVAAFFFLADGRSMWQWFVGLFPARQRDALDRSFNRAWQSTEGYARTQTIVAAADAVGIGLGAWALGLPFVGPIALIVFVTGYVPVVGAFVSGALAVLIALAFQGPGTALVMALIVLIVQQLESQVLQPWLMGNALKLHPFAVIVAVATGGFLAGIVGALFAVPVVAFVKSAVLDDR
ncbi:MAG TPA: AI-2E family transporter [Marmoricola sp.]|nr:AI-2E family transporter [Marmoricola sp.]